MSPTPLHLPDEILLEILSHIQNYPQPIRQVALANFNLVNRQWYDVSIQKLYERPYLCGRGRDYELFVRTLCPSVIVHIKHTALAGLVKELDLKRLVHQSSKSTTARLLGRTKSSLETFIAPQASFAINCWASLSKCTKLRILDLSLVSECISFQSLNQTLRQTPDLLELHLPRCSSRYESKDSSSGLTIRWPGKLQHVSLSGSISGAFLWSLLRTPESFPPGLYSLSMLHCPGLDHRGIRPLLQSLAGQLTRAELRDLPNVKHGRFNGVLDWLPYLTNLTVSLDYIDEDFGYMPDNWSARRWEESKPLEYLTLVTSGQTGIDPNRCFTATDLYALIDERFLGRLRYLYVAQSSEWGLESEGAEFEALRLLVVDELDRENWGERRWHYEGLQGLGEMGYEEWLKTPRGRGMKPSARILVGR